MAHTETTEAIVLKTHNVGEADRFCILFTREKGKIAARARGVRKLTSRFGGSVLPLSHISTEVRLGSAGYMITTATRIRAFPENNVSAFLLAQQGLELLLRTLQDEEPLPEIFDATVYFLECCTQRTEHTVLPFTLQLLHLYGLLPDKENMYRFGTYSNTQMIYVEQSISGVWDALPSLNAEERQTFSLLCAKLISELSTVPLQAGAVMKDMNAQQPA